MKTEDLFKFGVTPKEGEFAGEKFIVESINADGVICQIEGKPISKRLLKHGEYDLWKEPMTLFEDHRVKATWGNLKKAVESAGLGDDVEFFHDDSFFPITRACFTLDERRKAIIVG